MCIRDRFISCKSAGRGDAMTLDRVRSAPMQTTLNPRRSDDPHDVLVVAPDVALMVPTDEELSKLARSLRHPADPLAPAAAGLSPGPTVPPVDTTFRPAAVGDVKLPTTGGKAARTLTAALLA